MLAACPCLLLLWLVCLLLLPSAIHSATLNWIQSAGGSIHSPANWDTKDTPRADDDLIITLQPPQQAPNFTLPHELNHLNTLNTLTLPQPLNVRSITLSGDATLYINNAVNVNKLIINADSQVRVRGGSLNASAVAVAGLLLLDLSVLSVEQLLLQDSGVVYFNGNSGSNTLSHSNVHIQGTLIWSSGPLILDHSVLTVESNGLLIAAGEAVVKSGETDKKSEIVVNNGRMLFNSSAIRLSPPVQTLGITLSVASEGTVELVGQTAAASLFVIEGLKSSGRIVIREGRKLVCASDVQLESGSVLQLFDDSVLKVQSSMTSVAGEIQSAVAASADSFDIHSFLNVSGVINVNRMSLRGGVVTVSTDSSTAVHILEWRSGTVTGVGRVSVRDLMFVDGESSKVMQRIQMEVTGMATLSSFTRFFLQDQANLSIKGNTAYLLFQPDSSVSSDDSPAKLHIDRESSVRIQTSTPSTGSLSITTLSVLLESQSNNLTVGGSGEFIVTKSAEMTRLTMLEQAKCRFKGDGINSTNITISEMISVSGQSQLILQSAAVSFASNQPQSIASLFLTDAQLTLSGDLYVGRLQLGSSTTMAQLDGQVTVSVNESLWQSGTVTVDTFRVLKSLLIDTLNYKLLSSRWTEFKRDSVVSVQETAFRVSDGVGVLIENGAEMRLIGECLLDTVMSGNVSSFVTAINFTNSTLAAPPPLLSSLLTINGTMTFVGKGQQTTEISIPLQLNKLLQLNNTQPGQFQVILQSGFRSDLNNSLLSIQRQCLLQLICPEGFVDHCQYGQIMGNGSLTIDRGVHDFRKSISIHTLAIQGGGNSTFWQQLSADEMTIEQAQSIKVYHSIALPSQNTARSGTNSVDDKSTHSQGGVESKDCPSVSMSQVGALGMTKQQSEALLIALICTTAIALLTIAYLARENCKRCNKEIERTANETSTQLQATQGQAQHANNDRIFHAPERRRGADQFCHCIWAGD